MEKIKEDLSEITYGKPPDTEESFYSQRRRCIDAAYTYLSKKLTDQRERRNADLALRLAWGFLLGMLFGFLVLHADILPKMIQEILH